MARDPYKYFRVEAREIAGQLGQALLELERSGRGDEIVPRLLRLAHTLKGAARVVRQPEIADHAHAIEGILAPFRELAGTVPRENVDAILKLVDAITGRVAALTAPEDAEPAHDAVAPVLSAPAKGAPADEIVRTVRTDVAEIDDLLDGISESYVQLGALSEIAALAERTRRLADHVAQQLATAGNEAASVHFARFAASTEDLAGLAGRIERGTSSVHERLERELRLVRDTAEQLRLVPAGALFADFERAARDSAQVLGKQMRFEGSGGDIRLDAHVVRIVQDASTQLIRNAVAHGIETRERRLALGKPAQGRVAVAVMRRGRQIVFRVEDDGAGIDMAGLKRAAERKGRSPAEIELAARDPARFLLQAGLTTSAAVSEVAGRGIGMDIVRDAVAKLGAEFSLVTEPGKGTRFDLAVPLSMSSVEALMVEGASGEIAAAIPLSAVRHTLRLEARDVHRTPKGEAILHDGQAVPLVSLERLLDSGKAARRGDSFSAVVVGAAAGPAAISVERLRGTANVVVRALPDLLAASPVVGGASLDADGRPMIVLDPGGVAAASRRATEAVRSSTARARPLLVIDDSLTTRMLEQSILESAGYHVDVATSGEEGLERVRRADYALILVDVEMPGMDGFTFIEHIRRDPKVRNTPAILVTSRNAPEDKRRGEEVGANDYVVKSEFDQTRLLERIRELVQR